VFKRCFHVSDSQIMVGGELCRSSGIPYFGLNDPRDAGKLRLGKPKSA